MFGQELPADCMFELRKTHLKININQCIFLDNHADRPAIQFVYYTTIANCNIVHDNCNTAFSLNCAVQ